MALLTRWGVRIALVVTAVTGADAVARPAAPDGRVVVHSEATVDMDVVRLGDIAVLTGTAEPLASLEVGRAPKPGAKRSLPGAVILARLRVHGVDLDAVGYTIPPLVRVYRRAQHVPPAVVRAAVEEYVAGELQVLGERARVRSVDVAAPGRLAPGPYATRVRANDGAPLAGKARFTVEFLQDGEVVEAVGATAHIEVFTEVYVAREALARGAIIRTTDLLAERREASGLPRGAILHPEDAIGMQVRVAIPPRTVLRHEQLGQPVVVRRGDVVTLLAEAAGLRVTAKGEVREDAPRNAQVRVWNLGSRREVVGRVVDATTVAVTF